MLKRLRLFCTVLSICTMLFISSSSYAGGTVSTSAPLEMTCPEIISTTKYKQDGNKKVQLSLAFNGIWAKGYTKGMITKESQDMDEDLLETFSEDDLDILDDIIINVVATCIGSGKTRDITPDQTFLCPKGDGLHITLSEPSCSGKKGAIKGIFTLTSIADVDDGEVVVKSKILNHDNLKSGSSSGKKSKKKNKKKSNGFGLFGGFKSFGSSGSML